MNLKDAGIYDLINIFTGKSTAAHKMSQGGIINANPRLINIPAYQRPYRWTADNINRLFLDYDDNEEDEEYFLGSAVFVEKDNGGNFEFDVVDGQQRITTLYLLNFIRFLLAKEYVLAKIKRANPMKISQYCNELKDYYIDIVGKNEKPFKSIIDFIDNMDDEAEFDMEMRSDLEDLYKTELCIAETQATKDDTEKEIHKKAKDFFDNETLCLKYTRRRYDEVLRQAMASVYLKNPEQTTEYMLTCLLSEDELKRTQFLSNYTHAMITIFNNIWDRASEKCGANSKLIEKCEKAITFADEIIKNLSVCIVLTENESDANKLFEVLNDRSLAVDDLELIKNHFYKEYCTKSSDSDSDKDKRIVQLDELWVDKVFHGNTDNRNNLISYMAAVYLTSDKELSYKDNTKLKDAIAKKYSKNNTSYEYDDILADFNAYFAIKILISKVDLRYNKRNVKCLDSEQSTNSIVYKAMHLLNALDYISVMAAITNVIVAFYANNIKSGMTDHNFEMNFGTYIDELLSGSTSNADGIDYSSIYDCAFILWTVALKAKNHKTALNIARGFIEDNGKKGYSSKPFSLTVLQSTELDKELEDWLKSWTYNNNKMLSVKILLLYLLLSDRKVVSGSDGYNAKEVTLDLNSALAYKLDASKLELDHLEADKIDTKRKTEYYKYNDLEKRQQDVNGYLGNFMILDSKSNIGKTNDPLVDAMTYYTKISKSWLVDDINKMIDDTLYFDKAHKVPKEEFFKNRSHRLKCYIKAVLGRANMNVSTITVKF